MDLLKTILLYLSVLFVSSVNNTVDTELFEEYTKPTPTPTAIVEKATDAPTAKPTPVPTIDITPNPDYKTFRMGDKGEDVVKLQEKLAEYGYFTGEVDGRYGNQTRRAVAQFQYVHGLSADGIAGRATLTILYDSNQVRPNPEAAPTVTPSSTPVPATIVAVPDKAEPEEASPAEAGEVQPEETAAAVPETPVEASAEAVPEAPVEAAAQAPAEEPVQASADSAAFVPLALEEDTGDTPAEPEEAPAEEESTPYDSLPIYVNAEALTDEQDAPYTSIQEGGTVFVPFVKVLGGMGINVLSNFSIDTDEVAFPLNDRFVRFSYTQDQAGNPIWGSASVAGTAIPISNTAMKTLNDLLYLPVSTLQELTGAQVEINENGIFIVLDISLDE